MGLWKHSKKYKNKFFKGQYVHSKTKNSDGTRDRGLNLLMVGGTKVVECESPQDAIVKGFIYVKTK